MTVTHYIIAYYHKALGFNFKKTVLLVEETGASEET
jgi:hypothetical protein